MLDSEFNKIGIKNPLKILHNPTYEELYIEETFSEVAETWRLSDAA